MAKKIVNPDVENLCDNLQSFFLSLNSQRKRLMADYNKANKNYDYKLEVIGENIAVEEIKAKISRLYDYTLSKELDALKIQAAVVNRIEEATNKKKEEVTSGKPNGSVLDREVMKKLQEEFGRDNGGNSSSLESDV